MRAGIITDIGYASWSAEHVLCLTLASINTLIQFGQLVIIIIIRGYQWPIDVSHLGVAHCIVMLAYW